MVSWSLDLCYTTSWDSTTLGLEIAGLTVEAEISWGMGGSQRGEDGALLACVDTAFTGMIASP